MCAGAQTKIPTTDRARLFFTTQQMFTCNTALSPSNAQITALVDECLAISSSLPANQVSARFKEAGLEGADLRSGYGFTKAAVNMYMMYLAREHPNLLVNSCTPGWIATDLARKFVGKGKSIEEMGGKPPSDGAKTPIFLTLGDVPGTGWYFGSDALRSPLDRYRNPGDPAYDGK